MRHIATNISITRRRSGGRGRALGAGRPRAGRPARGGRGDTEAETKTVKKHMFLGLTKNGEICIYHLGLEWTGQAKSPTSSLPLLL